MQTQHRSCFLGLACFTGRRTGIDYFDKELNMPKR